MTSFRAAVHRRHVFFLSGFDPKGASYYHALYRTEAPAQAAVSGYAVDVGVRQRDADGVNRWKVHYRKDDQHCETTVEFARWDDLVRRHWLRSTWALLADMVRMYSYALACGVIPKLWRLARRPVLAWGYPAAFLLGALVIGLIFGGVVVAVATLAGVAVATAWLVGAAVLALVLWTANALERRLNTTWLARIYSFARRQALGSVPELESRVDHIARAVAHVLRSEEVDEVLVVGFSVGSILGVSALARAFDALDTDKPDVPLPAVSLLTLGHCIPMLGLLPEAERFRAELAALAKRANLKWVDFSSPTDWGSFALVDPVSACVPALEDRVPGLPTMRSPRFHTLFRPERYLQLRRDKRRMHLQYLLAGELPGGYDYFRMTAGLDRLTDSADERKGGAQ